MKAKCRSCGRDVIDRKLCQRGRGCRKTVAAISTNPVPQQPAKQITHVALLLDSSGSMGHLKRQVIDSFNAQIATIKEQSYKSGQLTYISFYTFGRYSRVHKEAFAAWIEQAPFLSVNNYYPDGQTPLVDCLATAIDDLTALPNSSDPNVSFLVIVMTDGEENYSSAHNRNRIKRLIQERTATDRWTFAFAGPRGADAQLGYYGILAGNFTCWDQTAAGVESYTRVVNYSTQGFYNTRAAGATATKNFFQPDFTNVNDKTLKSLTDLNNRFVSLVVRDSDCTGLDASGRKAVEITDFVAKRGLRYQVGNGFYQLSKPEDIQDHKELAIKNIRSGEIYGGREAKDLLKLPQGGTFRVRPNQHPDYKLFVQSTSMNRKLVAGTEFLYRIL